ncbi:MAG TPA: hypothetical protein VHD63_23980 [Ktedonobacteraceae bacterium]|nr:hypothetical protein [Ktedonobacteraceae bacterium]
MRQKFMYQPARTILEDGGTTVLLILLVLVGAFLTQTNSVFAATASVNVPDSGGVCSHPKSNGHCYATRDWPGATPGAFTNLSPYGSIYCGGCDGFIDNELWLSDTTSSQCTTQGCWVEAGIEAISSSDSYDCTSSGNAVCLFWADSRPNGGGFHHHALDWLGDDGMDLDPWYFFVKIRNNTNNSASGNTWYVDVQSYYNSTLISDDTGLSTNNNMTPRDIIIGSELDAIPGYAWAGENDFQYNQWLDTSGNWHEQTALPYDDGTDGPPDGWWTQNPNSTNGGIWSTQCCSIG